MEEETKKYLHFLRGETERLVDAIHVMEIIPMVLLRQTEEINKQNKFVGLLDYRGKVLPVFDIENHKNPDIDPNQFLVVIQSDSRNYSVIANEVIELVTIHKNQITDVEVAPNSFIQVGKKNGNTIRILANSEIYSNE